MTVTKERLNQYKYLQKELEIAEDERAIFIQQEMTDIKNYIFKIPNGEIRLLFQYRYMQGLTWKQVSKKMYGFVAVDAPRKKVERYLKMEAC